MRKFQNCILLILISFSSCNSENKNSENKTEVRIESDSIDSTKLNESRAFKENKEYLESISQYFISGEVDNGSYFLPNVRVAVYSNWLLDTAVFTNDTGYFKLDYLPVSKNYQIYFSKADHISKFCLLKKIDISQLSDSLYFFPLSINSSLYPDKFYDPKKLEALKLEPAAISSYNRKIDHVEWDMKKIEEYKNKLEAARIRK